MGHGVEGRNSLAIDYKLELDRADGKLIEENLSVKLLRPTT